MHANWLSLSTGRGQVEGRIIERRARTIIILWSEGRRLFGGNIVVWGLRECRECGGSNMRIGGNIADWGEGMGRGVVWDEWSGEESR